MLFAGSSCRKHCEPQRVILGSTIIITDIAVTDMFPTWAWQGSKALYLPFLLAVSHILVQSVYGSDDVLMRSDDLWESMEEIHRQGVDVRIQQVVDKGTFDNTVTLGYGHSFNWIDVWGPTYICPTMEHWGTVGDGGKWLCGVQTMLQRCDEGQSCFNSSGHKKSST